MEKNDYMSIKVEDAYSMTSVLTASLLVNDYFKIRV